VVYDEIIFADDSIKGESLAK